MEEIMSKKEFNELMKIKGEMWGVGMRAWIKFVVDEEGEEGLKKLEDTMAKLGYPVKYREINPLSYHPIRLLAITLPVAKRLFNYDDKKFQELGRFHIKIPGIIRILIRVIVSPERFSKEFPRLWGKAFSVGEAKVEYSKEKKYMIVRLENFRFHPIYCQILIGTFSDLFKMLLKSETTCEETKCLHRGDEYHEFLIKW